MSNHYELTDETIHYEGRTLHRIRATRDLPYHHVKAGDLGGYVEHLDNLSDSAWVSEVAMVYDNALVAVKARVSDYARVYGNAKVFGNARVYGVASMADDTMLHGDARVSGKARLCGMANVYENAHVCGNALVSGNARVCSNAYVTDNAIVSDDAVVYDNAQLYDNAQVLGDTLVYCNAELYGNARVNNEKHIMVGTLYTTQRFNWTLHRTTDGHVLHIGENSGTLDEHQITCDSDAWFDTADPEIVRAARSEYQAVIDQCRARIARWTD